MLNEKFKFRTANENYLNKAFKNKTTRRERTKRKKTNYVSN